MERLYKLAHSLDGLTDGDVFVTALDDPILFGQIIDFIQQDQLKQGKDGDDNLLPEYSINSQKTGNYDLEDTGDFYRSTRIKINKDAIIVEADTIKDGFDIQEYSETKSIIKLNEENTKELRDIIISYYKDFLLGKML